MALVFLQCRAGRCLHGCAAITRRNTGAVFHALSLAVKSGLFGWQIAPRRRMSRRITVASQTGIRHSWRRMPAEPTRLSDLTPQQRKSGLAAWLGWMFDGLDMHIYTLVATLFVALLVHGDSLRDEFSKAGHEKLTREQ